MISERRLHILAFPAIFLFLILAPGFLFGVQKNDKQGAASTDQSASQTDQKAPSSNAQQDPLKRPLSGAQKEAGRKEIKGQVYKDWVNKDVRWIITEQELAAFKKLSTDAERDQFIENFWQRRDPTPDTPENEFREEHFRRMAYANDHFAAGVPGWKTDRGRIYIVYGPPDGTESHPMGGPYERPAEEGGGSTSTFPFEIWTYHYIEGIGENVNIEFVDTCGCNEYHMTMDRSEKDALLMVPNAGLTDLEAMGITSKTERFFGGGLERLGQSAYGQSSTDKEFDRLDQFAKLQRQPEVKFKDLREVVRTHLHSNVLPFDVRVDFAKITSDTVLMPITLDVPLSAMTFANKDGVQRGTINVFMQLAKLTGQPVQTFETTIQKDVPAELLPRMADTQVLFWKALPMRPGLYRLDVVLKDVNGGKMGTYSRSWTVPDYSDDSKLSASSLILADQVQGVAPREIGTGDFVIGATKVRPRVQPSDGKPLTFKREQDQAVDLWMQVYNLAVDEKTKKPSATFEYQIVNTATNQPVVNFTESTAQMGNVGDQVTLAKSVPVSKLPPGNYQVTIKVSDDVSKQVISPTARFAVQ